MKGFKDYELRLVTPAFNSSLTDIVMELQYLRRMKLGGSTPPPIFFQLKNIFHLLESLGSARIEGNRTTIAEAVEARIDPQRKSVEQMQEIENMERALAFIEDNVEGEGGISKALILELHKITVAGLRREGDKTPGYFRNENVKISGSTHVPPDYTQVDPYVEELLKFTNFQHEPKYDLLKVALAHHRFAWIHPFRNGNGRVVRLLTYAMLIERGFNVQHGRILNPSAVFCIDRETYYKMLSRGDTGYDGDLLAWCEYVLRGIFEELTKIDKLLDYEFLGSRILIPAIEFAREREIVTELEKNILLVAVKEVLFQASDIQPLTKDKLPQERSRILRRMKNRHLIKPIQENARKYVLGFSRGPILRGIINALERESFVVTGE